MAATTSDVPVLDVARVRADFPILSQQVYGRPLVYLDNANTTQKPQAVIDAQDRYYAGINANIHRATHLLSERATKAYESARRKVQGLLNAASPREIVFTRGCTDAINLVAQSWGRAAGQFKHRIEVKTGDEIETLADQFNLMSAELDDSYSSLEKKVAERTNELSTLNAIAARVSSSLNLNEIMADALERIMELTGMEHGVAYRIAGSDGNSANNGPDEMDAHLRVMAFRGLPSTLADLGDGLPLRQSAAGVAGLRGEPVSLDTGRTTHGERSQGEAGEFRG